MATRRDRDGRFVSRKNPPQFFKIILDDAMRDGRLGIPKKFVRNYGNLLSNEVTLKVPGGRVWHVGLVKSDSEVWFQNGWKEFAEFYSVARGYFLVFEYKGRSAFNVIIFDTSAVELDYPLSTRNGGKGSRYKREFQEPSAEETKGDVSVEILEDFSSSRKRKQQSQLPCPMPKKVMKTNSTNKFQRKLKLQGLIPRTGTRSGGLKWEGLINDAKQAYPERQFKGLDFAAKVGDRDIGIPKPIDRLDKAIRRMVFFGGDEKASALRRVSAAFKSSNPFFTVVMQPSYIFPGSRVFIPASAAKEFFNNHCGNVLLCDLDGRSWSLKFQSRVSSGKVCTGFYDGWKDFVLDSKLEVGDVCVFEVIGHHEILLKVSLFKYSQQANDHPSQGISSRKKFSNNARGRKRQLTADEKTNCLHKASTCFKSENPYFTVALQPSNVIPPCILRIPRSFSEDHCKKNGSMVLNGSDGRTWCVKYFLNRSNGRTKVQIYAGWRDFVQENTLQVGDVCVFELIGRDEISLRLKVFIFRRSQDAKDM